MTEPLPSPLKRIDGFRRESVVSLCCLTALFLAVHPQSRCPINAAPEQPDVFGIFLLDFIPHFVSELFICGERQPKSERCCRCHDVFMCAGGHVNIHHKAQAALLRSFSLTLYTKSMIGITMSSRDGEGVS